MDVSKGLVQVGGGEAFPNQIEKLFVIVHFCPSFKLSSYTPNPAHRVIMSVPLRYQIYQCPGLSSNSRRLPQTPASQPHRRSCDAVREPSLHYKGLCGRVHPAYRLIRGGYRY